MKKFLTIFLTVMLFSTAFSATAETAEFVVPNALKRMAAQLPEFEDPLLLRTKTVDNEIHVRVKGSPDAVYANWLGYQEEPEEVDLVNGVGVVDIEGHKYQLGATWNNKVYRDYYAYNGESDEWVPVKYIGVVKVGDTDMKLVSKSLSDVAYDENWVWVDNYLGGQFEPENNHIVNEATKENKNILAAGVPQGTMYVTQKAWSEVDVDGGVVYYVDGLYDASGYLVAYNSTAKNAQGQVVGTTTGWHYMVPSYQFYMTSHGKESNGAPNKAWIVKFGPWTATYTRAGKPVVVVKDEENTDYFKSGLAGTHGKVTWQLQQTSVGDKWFISEVVENYPDGEIAQVAANYSRNGTLLRYFITYRTDADETYRIKYLPDDTPAYGNYTGVDYLGDTMRAYTASNLKWANSKTKQLVDFIDQPIALIEWNNPPRRAK